MERIEARARAIAAEARDAAVARLVDRAGAALPGVEVMREGAGVTLTGRGLGRRMLDEPALRWIGSLVR